MKNNFSNEQLIMIFKTLSSKLYVRINKAGNIDVINPNRNNRNEHFVLYFTPSKKYLWRRWFAKNYCYPLNMKNRKDTNHVIYEFNGKDYDFDCYDFSKHAEFNTINESLDYFRKYMEKYHNIKL